MLVLGMLCDRHASWSSHPIAVVSEYKGPQARSRLPLLASRTVSGHTLQPLLLAAISTARQYFVPQGLYISQRREATKEKVWGLQVAPEKEEMVAALISLGSRANFGVKLNSVAHM